MANLIDQYVNMMVPKGGVKTPTAFSQLVPMDTVVNQDAINRFAFSRVDPEVNRMREQGMNTLMSNLGATGGLRSGRAPVRQQNLLDQFSRMRQEMAQPFVQEASNRLTDYYTNLMEEYYRDPNAFQYKPITAESMLGIQPLPQVVNPAQRPSQVAPLPQIVPNDRMSGPKPVRFPEILRNRLNRQPNIVSPPANRPNITRPFF